MKRQLPHPEGCVCARCFEDNKAFTKHDDGKERFDLVPPLAELELVNVLTHGAKKYSDDNWRKTDNLQRYYAAARRHLSAWKRGQKKDSESGLHHLAHAACCMMFIAELELENEEAP